MKTFLLIALSLMATSVEAANLKRLQVSSNSRYFETTDKNAVFLLGDTVWGLPRLTTTQIDTYMTDAQTRGFNFIQVSIDDYYFLGSGATGVIEPWTGGNTDSPNLTFWTKIDFILDQADARNIYVALVLGWPYNLPFSGTSNAQISRVGTFLGNRYQSRDNLIWFLAGEYSADFGYCAGCIDAATKSKFNVLAGSITFAGSTQLKSIHPGHHTILTDFDDQSWLGFTIYQSGHASDTHNRVVEPFNEPDTYEKIEFDYANSTTRPTFDAEITYEGTWDKSQVFISSDNPPLTAFHCRKKAYWSVLAGGAGVTYGHAALEEPHFAGETNLYHQNPNMAAWDVALSSPGRIQMTYVKQLMDSKSFALKTPDQTIMVSSGTDTTHRQAMRGSDGSWIWIYWPTTNTFTINMNKLSGPSRLRWYDPTNGSTRVVPGYLSNTGTYVPTHPGTNAAGSNDWVLILEVVRNPVRGSARFTGRVN